MDKSKVFGFLCNSVPLLESFSKEELQKLLDESTLITFEKDEAVIEYGEKCQFLGIIIFGKAEASIAENDGERIKLGEFGPGEFFGEISLMTGEHAIADVIGVTRCKALLIPQETFSTTLISKPKAVKLISKIMSKRLKKWPLMRGNYGQGALSASDDPFGFKLRSLTPKKILVVNCGSSSLKGTYFNTDDESDIFHVVVEKIDSEDSDEMILSCEFKGGRIKDRKIPVGKHDAAFKAMVDMMLSDECGVISSTDEISAVGHRVVHGADKYSSPVVVTDEVLKDIEAISFLAPLHNPINVVGIKEAQKIFTKAKHIAVFDTAFHHTLPNYAYHYGLPFEYCEEKKIRRYGFHGTSHQYVALKAAEYLNRQYNELEVVSCHLGNGASMCAIDHGRSIDTTMGFTPAEGLIMGTRAGDIDAAILIHLMEHEGYTAEELNRLINKASGLLGLSGVSNDMREIEKEAMSGNNRALLAYKTFSYRVRKTIGSYAAAMHGLDVLIFTGGIGQGSSRVRSLACQGLGFLGIEIDENKNKNADGFNTITEISTSYSKVKVLVIPTNEELMIARETLRTISTDKIFSETEKKRKKPVMVEVSAHHVHLTREHVDILFGKDHQLENIHDLSQPGQFACAETVDLVGPKGTIKRVRVLGPERPASQVEIARTEQFKLGVQAPIRESGSIDNTPGVTLVGPKGEVKLKQGVICALRHIHMSPEDAMNFGVKDRYMVKVRVEGDTRGIVFENVLIRVSPNFRLAMHIDTDEANAGDISQGAKGFIEGIQSKS